MSTLEKLQKGQNGALLVWGNLLAHDKIDLSRRQQELKVKIDTLADDIKKTIVLIQNNIPASMQSGLRETITYFTGPLSRRSKYIEDSPRQWCNPSNEFRSMLIGTRDSIIRVDKCTMYSITKNSIDYFKQWNHPIKYVLPGDFDVSNMKDPSVLHPLLVKIYNNINDLVSLVETPMIDHKKQIRNNLRSKYTDIDSIIPNGIEEIARYFDHYTKDMYKHMLGVEKFEFDMLEFTSYVSSKSNNSKEGVQKLLHYMSGDKGSEGVAKVFGADFVESCKEGLSKTLNGNAHGDASVEK